MEETGRNEEAEFPPPMKHEYDITTILPERGSFVIKARRAASVIPEMTECPRQIPQEEENEAFGYWIVHKIVDACVSISLFTADCLSGVRKSFAGVLEFFRDLYGYMRNYPQTFETKLIMIPEPAYRMI